MNLRSLFLLAVAVLTASSSTVAAAGAAAAPRPNVIVIFTDDQGYGDLGCYGSPNILTPNIDRLAAEGIRFTSFYAATFCGPSRAQIMTGSYAARVGHARNPSPNARFGLNPDEITVAELLRGAGYATMAIGKWHLGDAPEFLPTRQGSRSISESRFQTTCGGTTRTCRRRKTRMRSCGQRGSARPTPASRERGNIDARWKLVLTVDNEGKVEAGELYDLGV